MSLWESVAKLRAYRYQSLKKGYPYVFQWKWYSYRRYKVKLYVWGSSILAHFFIKAKVKPNYITAGYALMGLFGGVLLAIPNKIALCVGLSFFYFRGILDWTDGVVAHMNNQKTMNGALFDFYGAHLGWVFLWAGLGIYLGHSTSPLFYSLAPLIPTLFAANLHSTARNTFIDYNFLKKNAENKDSETNQDNKETPGKTNIKKIKEIIDKIFEHNARTVDLIVLFILIEMVTPFRILWIFYLSFLTWQAIIFTARLFLMIRGGWAEAELAKLENIIYKDR